jgi:hypothetical protein
MDVPTHPFPCLVCDSAWSGQTFERVAPGGKACPRPFRSSNADSHLGPAPGVRAGRATALWQQWLRCRGSSLTECPTTCPAQVQAHAPWTQPWRRLQPCHMNSQAWGIEHFVSDQGDKQVVGKGVRGGGDGSRAGATPNPGAHMSNCQGHPGPADVAATEPRTVQWLQWQRPLNPHQGRP